MNQPSSSTAHVSHRSQAPASNPLSADGGVRSESLSTHDRRRLGERAPIVLDATVFRGAELRLTRTVDLSSTGCALEACADPLAGRVTLQLVSSSGEVLRVQAHFRRSFQGADAYEFVDLDDTDRLTIAEIIDSLIIDSFRGPDH